MDFVRVLKGNVSHPFNEIIMLCSAKGLRIIYCSAMLNLDNNNNNAARHPKFELNFSNFLKFGTEIFKIA